MVGYIYKTTNKKTGKVYIGKCKSKKFNKLYYGSGVELHKDLEKYGYKRFKVKLIKRCYTLKQLNEEEKRLIAYYRDKLGRENCYNIANGGQGGFGHSSPEPRSFFIKRFVKRLLLIVILLILIGIIMWCIITYII